jgi:hypothetical protein
LQGPRPKAVLRTLGEQRLVAQRSGQRVAPMARGLGLQQRTRRPQIGGDAPEFELEDFRLLHRHRGPQLLPARTGKLEEIIQGTLGNAHIDGAVKYRKELPHGLIE